jgi:Spy/CpxP family protein refolding chaperone
MKMHVRHLLPSPKTVFYVPIYISQSLPIVIKWHFVAYILLRYRIAFEKTTEEVTMKKVYVVLAAVIFGALAVTAFAFGPGSGPMMGKGGYSAEMGPGFMGHGPKLDLSSEQLAAMKQIREKYRVDTEALRNDLIQKQVELRTVYADPNSNDATILAKQKEFDTLKQKMQDKMVQLRLEQRKIFTPEQLTKLSEAAQKFANRRGHGKGFGPGACGRM